MSTLQILRTLQALDVALDAIEVALDNMTSAPTPSPSPSNPDDEWRSRYQELN